MDDIAPADAGGAQGAGDKLGPGLDVPAGIADDRRFARGPRGGVDPHDLFHGHGKHAERIIVAQVLFGSKGQPLQVLETFDIFRFDTGVVVFLTVKRNHIVDPLEESLQAAELDGFEGLPGQGFEFFIKNHCLYCLSC